jgi:hypothetical protein
MTGKQKSALAPLDTTVSIILTLMVGFAVVMLIATIFGSGSIAGMRRTNPEVCVETRPGQGVGLGGNGIRPGGDGPIGLRDGVRWYPTEVEICDTAPSASTLALGGLAVAPGAVGVMGFFGLMWVVLRRARRIGVFADSIPRSLRLLGAFLLGWTLLSWVVVGLTRAALFSRMAEGRSISMFLPSDFPVVPVLVSLGLLTLAGVVTQAVALREDVEATI